MTRYSISGSIVLFKNNKTELKKAINSFLDTKLDTVLYLVDNSPTDMLRDLVTDERVVYIPSHNNPGFGAAHNLAIHANCNKSKYHLVLNPDVEFKEGVLEDLCQFMDNNPDIGNVMPKVTYENGEIQKLCKLLPTPLNLVGRRFGNLIPFALSLNEKYELFWFKYDVIKDIPNLSGCFMFMRSEVLDKIGGFDERFFMYMEDVDLNRRIRRISRTVFYPNVSIIHHYEKGSYKNRILLKHHVKSAIKYFNKWGWFYDEERRDVNNFTLRQFK